MTIQYCGKCTERIPQKDYVSGAVFEAMGLSYCAKCAAKVRPELEQDPEYQAAELAKTRAAAKPGARGGGLSRAGGQSMSGTGLFPSPSGKRSRTSVTMTAPAPQQGGAASGRVGTKRRSGSGAEGKSGQRGGIPLPWAVAAGLGAVALVAVIALWATRRGPELGPPTPRDDRAKQAPPVEVDLKRVTLVALAERHMAYGRENPQAFVSRIQTWRQFALEAAAYPELVAQANDSIKAIEGQLEQAATRRFEELRARAAAKAGEDEYDEALAAWTEFEAELKTPRWGMNVIEQQDKLRTAKKEHEATLAASFTRGEIPTEGYLANLFDGRSLDGWGLSDEGIYSVKNGVIEAANTSDVHALAHPDILSPSGKHVLLKDFYFAFQFKLLEGDLQYLFRMPISLKGTGGGAFTLSPQQGRFKFGTWYTAHTVVRGPTVQFWVDGALSLNTMENITTPEGRVMFAAARGDRYQLRNLQLRVLSEGAAYVPGVVPALERKAIPLLEHATSMGDILQLSGNCDRWTLAGGVVTMEPGAAADKASFILLGESSWRDYVFRFELSGLEGALGVILRDRIENKLQGELVKVGAATFPDKEKWYAVVVDVAGKIATVTVDGVEKHRQALTPPTGRVGLLLYPAGRCKVRNLVVEVEE